MPSNSLAQQLEKDKLQKKRSKPANESAAPQSAPLEQEAAFNPQSAVPAVSPDNAIHLQRTVGNEAVSRMVARKQAPVQRKTAGSLIQRDVAEDLDEMANASEQEQREQMAENPPPAMQVTNVQDASAARRKMSEIEGYRGQMQEGGRTGTVSGDQISSNETAIATLADYLVTAGEQGRTLSTFQQQVGQLREDYGRVSGQLIHLEAIGAIDRDQTASYRAEQLVGAATGANSAAESAAGIRGDAAGTRDQVQNAHNDLMNKGNEFSQAQRNASRAVHALNSALSNLNAGIIPREDDPELAAQDRAIKAKVSTMQSRLSSGLQLISTLGGATGLGAAAASMGGETAAAAAGNLGISVESVSQAISESWYREETNQISSQLAASRGASHASAEIALLSSVREAQTALFSALQTLEEKITEYQQARDSLRTMLDNFGAAADREGRGNSHYDVIAGLLGDVDVLAVQINTTISLGQTEQQAAGLATEARGRVEGTRPEGAAEREGGVTYYQPYQDFQLGNINRTGGLVYRASPQQIYFITVQRSVGSAYGGQGAANPVVEATVQELTELKETVQGMRSVLSQSLGLAMER
ncbi:MAG: hypothetical protein WAM60_12870 [Candidatus Promineifilaceae bacterium]